MNLEEQMVIDAQTSLLLKQTMELNERVLQLKKQLHQYKMASSECDQLKKDINNKVITKVLVPTIGNNFIQINPNCDKYRKMISERKEMFEKSMLAIEEQIRHNGESLNTSVIQLCKSFKQYLERNGLEVPE